MALSGILALMLEFFRSHKSVGNIIYFPFGALRETGKFEFSVHLHAMQTT